MAKNDATPTEPKDLAVKDKSRPAAKVIKIPEDRSLPVEEYVRLGCTSPGQPWGAGDLHKVRTVFATNPLLERRKRPPLPRFGSKRSGELFGRITSSENFDRLRDREIPLKSRLEYSSAYLSPLAGIHQIYHQALLAQEVGDCEMLELCKVYLQLGVVWKELVEESVRVTGKNDPDYAYYEEGVEHGKKRWALFIDMGLSSLAEKESYRAEERLKFLGAIKKTVPALAAGVTPEARKDILRSVEELLNDPDQKVIHSELTELRQLIQKAATKK